MSDFKHVRFTKWHGPYQSGHWATFPSEQADRLVQAGKAVYHDPHKDDEAPAKRTGALNKMITK